MKCPEMKYELSADIKAANLDGKFVENVKNRFGGIFGEESCRHKVVLDGAFGTVRVFSTIKSTNMAPDCYATSSRVFCRVEHFLVC